MLNNDRTPEGYAELLGIPATAGVTWLSRFRKKGVFVHPFSRTRSHLTTKLTSYRKTITSVGVIWVSPPMKVSGIPTDIPEDVTREVALPLGFVDIKVCAVDAARSGLKLMVRKELR